MEQVKEFLKIFTQKHHSKHIYFHSDGCIDFITEGLSKNQYTYFSKETPIMLVLSDLIYAKNLICSLSSLSRVASLLGPKELVLYPDKTDNQITSPHGQTISSYLESEKTFKA